MAQKHKHDDVDLGLVGLKRQKHDRGKFEFDPYIFDATLRTPDTERLLVQAREKMASFDIRNIRCQTEVLTSIFNELSYSSSSSETASTLIRDILLSRPCHIHRGHLNKAAISMGLPSGESLIQHLQREALIFPDRFLASIMRALKKKMTALATALESNDKKLSSANRANMELVEYLSSNRPFGEELWRANCREVKAKLAARDLHLLRLAVRFALNTEDEVALIDLNAECFSSMAADASNTDAPGLAEVETSRLFRENKITIAPMKRAQLVSKTWDQCVVRVFDSSHTNRTLVLSRVDVPVVYGPILSCSYSKESSRAKWITDSHWDLHWMSEEFVDGVRWVVSEGDSWHRDIERNLWARCERVLSNVLTALTGCRDVVGLIVGYSDISTHTNDNEDDFFARWSFASDSGCVVSDIE